MYRNFLAICLIFSLPAVLTARPFFNEHTSLSHKSQVTQEEESTTSLQEKILEELLHRMTSQEQLTFKDSKLKVDKDTESEDEEIEEANAFDAGLFEGDIALSVEDIVEMQALEAGVEIQKNSSWLKKWPDGKVYYSFDEGFPQERKLTVLEAMLEYADKTCLTFHEKAIGQRINITHRESGCWSLIGRQKNIQKLSLGSNCKSKGTALHMIGHAVGFYHEQSRPDRDRYIIIHRENIKTGKEHNFNLKKYTNYQDEPYNYESIMHYGSKYFSNNKEPTITVRDEDLYKLKGRPKIGSRTGLTDIDVVQINKQYGCYVPNSSPGKLEVRVLQAGPFSHPAHYYVCVIARDSEGNEIEKCSHRDAISTTDPEWNEMLLFETESPDAQFYSFDILVRELRPNNKYRSTLKPQTIWVESKQHSGKYYTNKEQSVLYKYNIVE